MIPLRLILFASYVSANDFAYYFPELKLLVHSRSCAITIVFGFGLSRNEILPMKTIIKNVIHKCFAYNIIHAATDYVVKSDLAYVEISRNFILFTRTKIKLFTIKYIFTLHFSTD